MTLFDYNYGAVELASQTRTRVNWLWHQYIPLGKLTLVEGDPGDGKSTILGDLAARITSGSPMPDGFEPQVEGRRGLIYLAGEEDLGDTLLPRIEAMGGDPSQVLVRQTVGSWKQPLQPTIEDVDWIRADVLRKNAAGVFVDPLTEFIAPGVRTIDDASVRDALAPLRDLATELQIALVMVRHLRKAQSRRLIHAGAGSMGFAGAARAVLQTLRDPNQPSERLLLPIKVSNAPEGEAWKYRVADRDGVGVVEWLGTSDITPWNVEAGERSGVRNSRLHEAAEWLYDLLREGPVPTTHIQAAAEAAGISWSAVRRAKGVSVPVRVCKDGSTGRWIWKLEDEDAQDAHVTLRAS